MSYITTSDRCIELFTRIVRVPHVEYHPLLPLSCGRRDFILAKVLSRRKAKRRRTIFLRLTDAPLLFTLRPMRKALEVELNGGVEAGFDGVAMFV